MGGEIYGAGQHEAVVVVGVFANQVYATGGADERGVGAGELLVEELGE